MAQVDPLAGESNEVLELQRCFQVQQAARTARPRDYAQRVADLNALATALKAHTDDLLRALDEDFGPRSRHETLLAEIIPVLHEIRYTRKRLHRWMRPKRVSAGWQLLPASAYVVCQPRGVVGIVAPWNYPVNLTLWPLVSALAAGNRVMLKPSEHAPSTARALHALLAGAFEPEQVCVVTGGVEVGAAFCALPFDHLLFTGATEIGRKVLAAAAPNLTPVTLELGGKTPTILDQDYSLRTAATRILHGKLLNAGQTCVAPDYLLIHEKRLKDFVEMAPRIARELYPGFVDNPDYTSIINQDKYRRLENALADARDKGARIIPLTADPDNPDEKRMMPCLVLDTSADMQIMREEVFGPALPIVPFADLDEAIAFVNAQAPPLALYYFGSSKARAERVVNETRSGGVGINEVVAHVAVFGLPFGGVGPSGMGHYHGEAGFLTFSKQKGVFSQRRWSPLALLNPPYGKLADRMMKILRG